MKINEKLHSVVLTSAALILFLILVSSTASAATEQSALSTGPYAYITSSGDNIVYVIDTTTNEVVATVPVGSNPEGIAINSAGTKVYTANGYGSGTDTISVIDTATNTVTATVPVGSWPAEIVINPNGTKAYVANSGSNTISVIDTATNTVTATVPVEIYPHGIAINPAGTKVYAVNVGSGTVSIIDTATNTVIDTVSVGEYAGDPVKVAVNPDGTKLYVTGQSSNTVSVVDTSTNTVTATVPVGSGPLGVAVGPDGTRAYVANRDSNTVSIIDTETNTVVATVPVGSYPAGIAVSPDGTKAYVVNRDSNTVSIIDTETNTVVATVSVGNVPCCVAVGPAPEPVLPVANFTSNVTSGYAPLTVQFIDHSINATGWSWAFGDGTSSMDQSPMHTYSIAGNYTVNLTVSNENGTNSMLATINVSEKPVVRPIANFSANPTSGKAPLTVVFTDTSTGTPNKWIWIFGDGTNSTDQNPVHNYSQAGNYTVKLTATNAAGSSTKTRTSYIRVKAPVKPVAAFSAKPTSGKVPLTVAFTDKSTGIPTKWKWNFGDGKTSTQQNPKHQYLQEGNYKVTLTVTNVAGSNTATKTNFIKVTTNTRPGIYSKN